MDSTAWAEPSPARHQSNIRSILEQVKCGAKNKSEAFSELRSILNSSARGLGPTLKSNEETESSGEELGVKEEHSQNFNTVSPPSRFTHEDRRMLINKLIEKKRRSEADILLDPQNSNSVSAPNDMEFHYGTNSDFQGEDENKWGNDSRHRGNQNVNNPNDRYQNRKSDTYNSDYEGDREEKGWHKFFLAYVVIVVIILLRFDVYYIVTLMYN